MIVLSVILGVLLAASVCLLLLLKRDVRQINGKLKTINDTETNAQVTTETFDKNIITLADSVNSILERSRRDLYEKIRAEADLKRAITNISHDLRTPLTSALGYLQMLEGSGLDDETRARYLETIKGRLEALSVLMNSLFEFAQVIEGKTEFDLQKINACNALCDALSENYSELESKGFTVEVDVPDAPVMCICDGDALRRILQNLMKNVCVHGVESLRVSLAEVELQDMGGKADISPKIRSKSVGAAAAKHCVIKIANKVDGADDLEIERLFDRFYTADASRTSKNTGLGLAIAKELTERMGGQISAYREADMLVLQIKLPM
jgi:signal transduction histidine kinase